MRGTDKPTVLLVDDERESYDTLNNVFVRAGYELKMASTFEEALKVIHSTEDRDIVAFVDNNSPALRGGNALLHYIQLAVPDRVVPYVWTRATSQTQDLMAHAAALGVGVYRVFFKGVDPVELMLVYARKHDVFLRLVHQSEEDFMTGLRNRKGFTREVTTEFMAARDRGHPEVFSLIMIDVDRFKHVNDTFGHLVGDEALKAIGQIIARHVRFSDRTCRYGGDEFLVLLSNMDEAGAARIGEKIQAAVKATAVLRVESRPVPLSISYGVGEIRRDEIGTDIEQSLEMLIERAEMGNKGLHEARRNRRR
jgi:two-component system, cell cycle response regulator